MTALVAAVVVGGALSACAGETDGGLRPAEQGDGKSVLPVAGTPWLVQEVTADGRTHRPPEGMVVPFRIEDGRAVARVCNGIGGPVDVGDGTVRFHEHLPSTDMGCEGIEFENVLSKALNGEMTSEVGPESLTLSGTDGIVVELGYDAPVPLKGTKWHAVEQPPGGGLWLRFTEDGGVEGDTGCNAFHGEATVHDTGPIEYGPLAMTRKACDPETGPYEKRLLEVLSGTGKVSERVAGSLTLEGAGGDTMEFTARP